MRTVPRRIRPIVHAPQRKRPHNAPAQIGVQGCCAAGIQAGVGNCDNLVGPRQAQATAYHIGTDNGPTALGVQRKFVGRFDPDDII